MSDDSADKRAVGSASGIIFRKSISPMDVLDASRSRPDVFSKLYCGYSTPARSGIWLPQSYPNYNSVHWRFQTWCRDEVLRRVLMDVANELRDKGALDEAECFIDA